MRHDKKQVEKSGIFVKKSITGKDFFSGLYDILERIPLFLPFINPLIKKYRVFLNADIKECSAAAARTFVYIYAVSVPAVAVLFGLDPSFFTFFVSVFAIRFIADRFVSSSCTSLEIKFLKAFDSFLNTVRHNYYKCGSVKTAIELSENEAEDIMKGHIRELYKCLDAADPDTEAEKYLNTSYHKYLKLLLTLVRLVEENGDIEDEKGSVFLNSCMHLKYEIEEDIRFINEKKHRFSGLMYTAVLPVAAIPFIAKWGTSTIPSLNIFYYGYSGSIVKAGLLLVTVVCYNALMILRSGDETAGKKHKIAERLSLTHIGKAVLRYTEPLTRGKRKKTSERIRRLCEGYDVKTFYTLKLMYLVLGFWVSCFVLISAHMSSASIYRHDIPDVTGLVAEADARQLSAMETLIPVYVDRLIDSKKVKTRDEIKEELLLEKDIQTEKIADAAAGEILNRISLYENEKFGLKDMLIAVICAVILYCFPDIGLWFRSTVSGSKIQDEIMQFQSIIHMLKKVPGISVIALLEEMERFSEIYKPVIRQCINEYSISDEDAITRMYEVENNKDFKRIADCFLAAEEIGLDEAFAEISSEIENFKENRKLDRKIMLDSEAMLGAVLAVLPGGLILFGYLLGPFMIRSVQIFDEYRAGIAMSGS